MVKEDLNKKGFINLNDEGVFVQVYDRYWNKIYRTAKNRLNCPYEAEEVVQEIFLSLWKNRNSFVLSHGFDNYFAIAVKNQIINRLAQRQRMKDLELEMTNKAIDAEDSTLGPVRMFDLQQQIKLCLTNLSERCQLIFDLKYYHGYSQRHIAEKLLISEKTVEANLAKARKKLKSGLPVILLLMLMF